MAALERGGLRLRRQRPPAAVAGVAAAVVAPIATAAAAAVAVIVRVVIATAAAAAAAAAVAPAVWVVIATAIAAAAAALVASVGTAVATPVPSTPVPVAPAAGGLAPELGLRLRRQRPATAAGVALAVVVIATAAAAAAAVVVASVSTALVGHHLAPVLALVGLAPATRSRASSRPPPLPPRLGRLRLRRLPWISTPVLVIPPLVLLESGVSAAAAVAAKAMRMMGSRVIAKMLARASIVARLWTVPPAPTAAFRCRTGARRTRSSLLLRPCRCRLMASLLLASTRRLRQQPSSRHRRGDPRRWCRLMPLAPVLLRSAGLWRTRCSWPGCAVATTLKWH